MTYVATVTIVSWVYGYDPETIFIACDHGVQNVRIAVCIVQRGLRDVIASAPLLATSIQISRPLSSCPNSLSKLKVRIRYLPLYHSQFLRLWYNGPTRLQSALAQWQWHSGLSRAYMNVVHWCATIFEAVVLLLYACGTHDIVPESHLNLANGFHLGIAKLAKFDPKSLISFYVKWNPTTVHYMFSIGRLQETAIFCAQKNIHYYAGVSSLHLRWRKSPALDWFYAVRYFLNTPRTCCWSTYHLAILYVWVYCHFNRWWYQFTALTLVI